jgi:hypothetical protein
MATINPDWKQISLPFENQLADALMQQHHASQFIAMAGRHLVPQEPDDSNTSMEYDIEKEMLVGKPLPNGFRLALNLVELTIKVLSSNLKSVSSFSLVNQTKKQAFDELKGMLAGMDVDVSGFKPDLHYEIPKHPLDEGATFSVKDKSYFQENVRHRHNAGIILSEISKQLKKAAAVKVWPHHFDTGSYIPLAFNKRREVTRSIGIGWAIPDSMVNEPYFFVSYWPPESANVFDTLPPLKAGTWLTGEWKGGVYKLSDFVNLPAAIQYKRTRSFFTSGIEALKNL